MAGKRIAGARHRPLNWRANAKRSLAAQPTVARTPELHRARAILLARDFGRFVFTLRGRS